LYLTVEPPQALHALRDPCDPAQNARWRLLDASFYRGHYYSYFSAVPVFLLFMPWRLLTGTYLNEAPAALFFMVLAFLVGVAALRCARRAYFPAATTLTFNAAILACGLGNLGLTLVNHAAYYHVPMACAYFWLMVALYCGLRSGVGSPSWHWLLAASLACGLAVASRPNMVSAVVAILPPMWLSWKQAPSAKQRLLVIAAAALPLGGCVGLILLHNWLRFDSVLEFGLRYQLSPLDFRHQAWNAIGNVPANLPAMLGQQVPLGRYYPFFVRNDVQPVGFVPYFPATLALLACGVLGRAGGGLGTRRCRRCWRRSACCYS
jgi:hypothetical protein